MEEKTCDCFSHENEHISQINRCGIDENSVAMEILKEQHEMNKKEHTSKTAIMILLIVLLFVTNGLWLYKWNQCDHHSTTTVISDNESRTIVGDEIKINTPE